MVHDMIAAAVWYYAGLDIPSRPFTINLQGDEAEIQRTLVEIYSGNIVMEQCYEIKEDERPIVCKRTETYGDFLVTVIEDGVWADEPILFVTLNEEDAKRLGYRQS